MAYSMLIQNAVSALLMIQCFHLADISKGVISCVTGKSSEIGDFLTMHLGINCISFTGGDTGIAISMKGGMIPLQMELGGKDAYIVLEDADLHLATANVVKGRFLIQKGVRVIELDIWPNSKKDNVDCLHGRKGFVSAGDGGGGFLSSTAKLAHLVRFATSFGAILWATFIGGDPGSAPSPSDFPVLQYFFLNDKLSESP